MRQFLWGSLATSSLVVTLLFLRYWTVTRDRLFLFFAIAFAVMGINWISLAVVDSDMEHRYVLYVPRLLAFLMIIAGIVDKNRRSA